MKLTAKPQVHNFRATDVVAIFLSEEFEKEIDKQIIPELSFIRERVDLSAFKGKSSESMMVPYKSFPNIIITGIGRKKNVTKETLRENAGAVVKVCKKMHITRLHVVLPAINEPEELSVVSAIGEGFSLSDYSFDKYKSKKDEEDILLNEMEEVLFYCSKTSEASKVLKEVEIISDNTKLCRDLINESSELANPVAIAKMAKTLTKLKGVDCRVYGKMDIEKLKMGLLLAVSKGSTYPPQLVVLKYRGNPKTKKHIAIVGKGITFDSGGMNLKTSAGIVDMRSDMSGAAACFYTVRAAAQLKLKKNITAVIPLCENMLSSNSYRAGDVIRAYNNKSVEVANTDAEGRLILGDAIAFTEKTLKPDYIIDIATLTGACLVCFGEVLAALLSNNDKLAGLIYNAGEGTGEKVWRLPLDREYEEMVKSDIADIRNVGNGRNAGTIVGAVFIKNFIKETAWAHIDIAGTAWLSKARGYKPRYATGYGVRLFLELFKTLDV